MLFPVPPLRIRNPERAQPVKPHSPEGPRSGGLYRRARGGMNDFCN